MIQKKIILDASALLALLQEEKGAGFVMDLIEHGASMTTLNLAEVTCKLYGKQYSKSEIDSCINELPINFIPITREIAELAASYYVYTKSFGLSLADKICLAAGKLGGYTVVTADKIWEKLDLAIDIKVIR